MGCWLGVPAMYDVCERLHVRYTFGLGANAVLQRETEGLLAEAVAAYERERQAARALRETDAAKEALFRQFLAWERQQTAAR